MKRLKIYFEKKQFYIKFINFLFELVKLIITTINTI